jgi:hypothetical protein
VVGGVGGEVGGEVGGVGGVVSHGPKTPRVNSGRKMTPHTGFEILGVFLGWSFLSVGTVVAWHQFFTTWGNHD